MTTTSPVQAMALALSHAEQAERMFTVRTMRDHSIRDRHISMADMWSHIACGLRANETHLKQMIVTELAETPQLNNRRMVVLLACGHWTQAPDLDVSQDEQPCARCGTRVAVAGDRKNPGILLNWETP